MIVGGKYDRFIRNCRINNVIYCFYLVSLDVVLYVSLIVPTLQTNLYHQGKIIRQQLKTSIQRK